MVRLEAAAALTGQVQAGTWLQRFSIMLRMRRNWMLSAVHEVHAGARLRVSTAASCPC